jgi:hypothetical protein
MFRILGSLSKDQAFRMAVRARGGADGSRWNQALNFYETNHRFAGGRS